MSGGKNNNNKNNLKNKLISAEKFNNEQLMYNNSDYLSPTNQTRQRDQKEAYGVNDNIRFNHQKDASSHEILQK